MSSRERILAVRLSSLGDVVQVTPCLRALRRARPQARLVAVVERRFADVLRNDPHLDELIEADASSGWAAFAEPFRRLADRAPFDLALDFQGLARSAAWVQASRATRKIGLGRLRPGWTTVPVDWRRHGVEEQAAVARAAGCAVEDLAPRIHVTDEDERSVSALLAARDLPSEGFVVLNPFSRWRSKAWPLARQAEVARRVAGRFGRALVVTGSADEGDASRALEQLAGVGRLVSLVGHLRLGEAFALYRRAALMLTCDSGPMHAAAALGTRVVALFGPTWPGRSGPWGPGHRVIQARRPPLHRMYRYDPLGAYIRAIDVDTVSTAVADALAGG